MTKLRRRFGFWNALGSLSLKKLFWSPEFIGAAIVGGGGAFALLQVTRLPERVAIAGDALVLTGALLGIVFAGFALVVSLLSDSYLRWLDETEAGVEGFFAPFIVAIGMQVAVVLAALAYRAAATHLAKEMERWTFGVIAFLFVFSALDVVALGRDVFAHGVARARGLRIDDLRSKKRSEKAG